MTRRIGTFKEFQEHTLAVVRRERRVNPREQGRASGLDYRDTQASGAKCPTHRTGSGAPLAM
jgi:hypothetical protein